MKTKAREAEKRAFWAGYQKGQMVGERSIREAEKDNPRYSTGETDAYCQGSVDRAAGDNWRLLRL